MDAQPPTGEPSGNEVNGYRWTGTDWVRVWKPGDEVNGYRFDGTTWLPIPTAPKQWWRNTNLIVAMAVGVVIVVFLGIVGIAAIAGPRSSTSASPPTSRASVPAAPSTDWVPTGFVAWPDDPNLAFTTSGADGAQCPVYADSCYKFRIASNQTCPGGIYVSISQLDAQKNVVGSGNEITGGVLRGDVVLVAVPGLTADAPSARLSELNCLS